MPALAHLGRFSVHGRMLPRRILRAWNASNRLWASWAVIVGVFAMFKTSSEAGARWYADRLEWIAWAATVLGAVAFVYLAVSWTIHKFCNRSEAPSAAVASPAMPERSLAATAPVEIEEDAIERESRARGLPDERFL